MIGIGFFRRLRVPGHVVLDAEEHGEDEERDERGGDRQRVEAGAGRHADGGVDPDGGGGGQAADVTLSAQDRAAAEKADAGDDLRRDARRIAAVRFGQLDRDQGEGRGAERDQRVRAEAGGALTDLALRAEHRAEHGGEQQAAERFELSSRPGQISIWSQIESASSWARFALSVTTLPSTTS